METTSATSLGNTKWNSTTHQQVSSQLELSGVRNSLFEQILNIPVHITQDAPEADSSEPPPEPPAESNQDSYESDQSVPDDSTSQKEDSPSPQLTAELEVIGLEAETPLEQVADAESGTENLTVEQATELEFSNDVEAVITPDQKLASHELEETAEAPAASTNTELQRTGKKTKSRGEADQAGTVSSQAPAKTGAETNPKSDKGSDSEIELELQDTRQQAETELPRAKRRRAKWFEQDGQYAGPQQSIESGVSKVDPAARTSVVDDAQPGSAAALSEHLNAPGHQPSNTPPLEASTVEPTAVTDSSAGPNPTGVQRAVSNLQLESSAAPNSENEGSEASKANPASKPGDKATAREAGSTDTGNKSNALTQQERVRLVQRVARSFNRLGPTGGQINLRLHPPHLGSLSVQVRLEGRDLTARLATETSAAREIILESLPALRGRLAEQGFEVSQFQVEVSDNAADASFSNRHDQTETSGRDGNNRASAYKTPRKLRNDMPEASVAGTVSAGLAGLPTDGGVDVHA